MNSFVSACKILLFDTCSASLYSGKVPFINRVENSLAILLSCILNEIFVSETETLICSNSSLSINFATSAIARFGTMIGDILRASCETLTLTHAILYRSVETKRSLSAPFSFS